VQFLTDVGDTVLDIFAGSNTTGVAAESLGRHWIAFELEQKYLAASVFRFLSDADETTVRNLYTELCGQGAANTTISRVVQPCLLDEKAEYSTDEPA
jgi:hypothetical protein